MELGNNFSVSEIDPKNGAYGGIQAITLYIRVNGQNPGESIAWEHSRFLTANAVFSYLNTVNLKVPLNHGGICPPKKIQQKSSR